METGLNLQLSEWKPGMSLPDIERNITRENIRLYAEASRDFNPIHIDEGFAAKTPLGGTIAHGMLVMAYISQMMTAAFGRSWLIGGQLDVRFKTPARPGDTLRISGQICGIKPSEGETLIECNVLCENQKGETVIIGSAKVGLNSKGSCC